MMAHNHRDMKVTTRRLQCGSVGLAEHFELCLFRWLAEVLVCRVWSRAANSSTQMDLGILWQQAHSNLLEAAQRDTSETAFVCQKLTKAEKNRFFNCTDVAQVSLA